MRLAALTLLATAVLAASCSGDEGELTETGATDAGALTIYAPSSVEDVFRELAPGADFRFGSSEELATAILEGRSRMSSPPRGRRPSWTWAPRACSSPRSSSRRTGSCSSCRRATRPESSRSTTSRTCSSGSGRSSNTPPRRSRRSEREPSPTPSTSALDAAEQVASGTAEAALVYYTDALAAGDAVRVIELPAQALVEYPIAVVNVSERFDEAEAFVSLLLGAEGRAALGAAGFGLPPETD